MSVVFGSQISNVKYLLLVLELILILSFRAPAQEIEARAYSRAPIGTEFILFSYAYQSGDVVLDSALPISDVKVTLNVNSAIVYGRTFGLAKHQANVSILVPYVRGRVGGTLFEDEREAYRSGLGDIRLRFSANLIGSPALKPREFVAYKPRTVLGIGITAIVPTGQYDRRRLVNLSSNRWGFKPEVGFSKPMGRWTVEGAAGVWLFTSNEEFLGDSRRAQKPVASLQAHLVYTFLQRMWASVGGSYYAGGRTVVNGKAKDNQQRNSRVGATFSFPVTTQHSIRIVWTKGLTARFGGKLSSVGVVWQYIWF